MLVVALATLGLAGTASAELTGEFTKFAFCPRHEPEVARCVHAVTTGGEVVLGSKTVPIVSPVTLQGGYAELEGKEFSKFFGATNGITLSKAAQPVPGGLLGLVPPKGAPLLVKLLIELAAENGLTKVDSTLELAQPASAIKINDLNLAEESGATLVLPLKAHLENVALGSSCYVGSSTSPIIWELTTGTTKPPKPNESITGGGGAIDFFEGGEILQLKGTSLVDNAWSAPAASGCGGALSALVDPILNLQAGLPSAAGHNTAILVNTITESPAESVNHNDETHP